jgi:hypothetical protein
MPGVQDHLTENFPARVLFFPPRVAHRHDDEIESLYRFVDVSTLIKDFIDAVRQRRKT